MKYERLLETMWTKDEKELKNYLDEIHNYMYEIWAGMDISRAIYEKIYGVDTRKIDLGIL